MADALDASEENESQADIFKDNDRILIHCVDLEYLFATALKSLPFVRLNVCCAHFSFVDSPSQRRSCILPLSEILLRNLHNIRSPAVVQVKSSCLYKVCDFYLHIFIHCDRFSLVVFV